MAQYIYIGSTKKTLSKRRSKHIRDLKDNKHCNSYMQNVWKKHKDNFSMEIIYECNSETELEKLEPKYIKRYKEKYGKYCMNLSEDYLGGSSWRKCKTKNELMQIDYNRTHLPPLKQKMRNKKHKETLKNTPQKIKDIWMTNKIKTYIENIKNHKKYQPMYVKFTYPNGKTEQKIFDSESIFFKETKFEYSSLKQLKKTGVKIVKKRLNFTKHNYPVGTVLELQKLGY